jgi:hypothetical protein
MTDPIQVDPIQIKVQEIAAKLLTIIPKHWTTQCYSDIFSNNERITIQFIHIRDYSIETYRHTLPINECDEHRLINLIRYTTHQWGEPTTPGGEPLNSGMCTCAIHCANRCEPACCPPHKWCNCWCHREQYENIAKNEAGLADSITEEPCLQKTPK